MLPPTTRRTKSPPPTNQQTATVPFTFRFDGSVLSPIENAPLMQHVRALRRLFWCHGMVLMLNISETESEKYAHCCSIVGIIVVGIVRQRFAELVDVWRSSGGPQTRINTSWFCVDVGGGMLAAHSQLSSKIVETICGTCALSKQCWASVGFEELGVRHLVAYKSLCWRHRWRRRCSVSNSIQNWISLHLLCCSWRTTPSILFFFLHVGWEQLD